MTDRGPSLLAPSVGAPDADGSAQRIAQLKRLQRRSTRSHAVPLTGEKPDDRPISESLETSTSVNMSRAVPQDTYGLEAADEDRTGYRQSAPLSSAAAPLYTKLERLVNFLRSSDTDAELYLPSRSYNSRSPEGQALQQLIAEMVALKQRDSSSAKVLTLAKENLDKRRDQIAQLQEEVHRKNEQLNGNTAGAVDYKQEVANLSEALDVVTRRHLAAEREAEALKGEMEELKSVLAARDGGGGDSRIAQLEMQNQDLTANFNQAKTKILELEDKLRMQPEHTQQVNNSGPAGATADAEKSNEELTRVLEIVSQQKDTIADLQDTIANEEVAKKDREEEVEALRTEMKDLQLLLKEKNDELGLLMDEHTDLGASAQQHAEHLKAQKESADEQARRLERLQSENARLKQLSEEQEDSQAELRRAKQIIEELEARQRELDGLLDGLQEERSHMDEVIQELKQKRIMVQQKDALIAELNEQIHSTNFTQDSTGPALFRAQQMQRDIQELRNAVKHRDDLIAELTTRLQNEGGTDIARANQLAERERAIAAQTQQLQIVSQHQYEMQAQLAAVQKALQEQQLMLQDQAEEQAHRQQQAMQIAAQAQQLAVLQQGINSVSGAPRSHSHGAMAIDAGSMNAAFEHEAQQKVAVAASSEAISKTPTAQEWSQNMGVDSSALQAQKAKKLARDAAAAASIARSRNNYNAVLPTEVTM